MTPVGGGDTHLGSQNHDLLKKTLWFWGKSIVAIVLIE